MDVAWVLASACAISALAAFAWMRRSNARCRARAISAERRLDILSQIAPPFTESSTYSTLKTCERIVDRFGALLKAELILCFLSEEGRLRLGGKSDAGYAGFLRVGEAYDGNSVVTWSQEHRTAAICGPASAEVPSDLSITDMARQPAGQALGPLAGSRDRVWALSIPLLTHRGYGLRPAVAGAIYAERKKDSPFSHDDLRVALMVARLAGDALQRAQFGDALRRDSEIDPLTQLLTAAAFRRRLRRELELRRYAPSGSGRDVALFFIDSDNFKLWNDSFGHFAGDMLLKRLAAIFREVADSGGFAGRNGGDEFCIALLDRTKDDAISVAEDLCARVEEIDMLAPPGVVAEPAIPVTVSIGVAHFPVDVPLTSPAPSDALLEAADARMYEAKRGGRNRVAYSRTRALPGKVRYPGEGPIPRR